MSEVARLIYNAAILFGTAYVVFGLVRFGWWFLLAIGFMSSARGSSDE